MDIALKWSSNNKDDDFDNENVIFFNFFFKSYFRLTSILSEKLIVAKRSKTGYKPNGGVTEYAVRKFSKEIFH